MIRVGYRGRARRDTGEERLRVVEEAFVREADALEDVVVEDAAHHDESITTTLKHPFWVEGLGWVRAGELAIGDRVITRGNAAETIVGLRLRAEHARVYNFTVEGAHSYFVGEGGVWVHNACPTDRLDGK